jgi:tRNA-uridine 2-sulfurtransferase
MKSKVLVAMSGGVDSSVTALILKKKGYEVTGAFMDLREDDDNEFFEIRDKAKDIAKIIDIPFCTFNLREEFKKKIINNFIKDYQSGITPNPCVDCNKEIKFGLFYERALMMGFDYIATGHYVRKREIEKNDSKIKEFELLKGKDKSKDQSYFLWRLNQNKLEKLIFPLGEYTKKEVRLLAKKNNLSCFDSKESQEICFVKETLNYFLKEKLGEKNGLIVDSDGKKIGNHHGLWFYTIGQRRGLDLNGGPFFVINKDIENNFLIVSRKSKDLYKKDFKINQINWIKKEPSSFPFQAKVKIRYGHLPTLAEIEKISNDDFRVIFNKSQKSITPGQSVVFYKGIELIGGGKINF